MRFGSGYGSGCSSTCLTTVKMAVLAPMPRAVASTAARVKPGALRSMRAAKTRSCRSMGCLIGERSSARHSSAADATRQANSAPTPARDSGCRARRLRTRRSRRASATAGSNTRSRTSNGTARRSHRTRSGMGAPARSPVGADRLVVERARRRPRGLAERRERVAPLLDDLRVDDLLVVLPRHEAGVLEARHHLVERRARAAHAMAPQRLADRAARAMAAAQDAEHEKLQVGDL